MFGPAADFPQPGLNKHLLTCKAESQSFLLLPLLSRHYLVQLLLRRRPAGSPKICINLDWTISRLYDNADLTERLVKPVRTAMILGTIGIKHMNFEQFYCNV
ncbi:hypothetical protein DUI87_16133 [Hirundo rustica rustica]|uniref:Uncharacterized protein n=1 Tax=Hirundo rustica rustica TaxID=333673 RepID=A0A3M0K0E6_HIRRU|nr:hypothetical protein DUI87_16133 [Hirundo rustica rustica]